MTSSTQATKFWTGVNCPACERAGGVGECPVLWIEDNADGQVYDGDLGYCDECGKTFSLLVDAWDHLYAYEEDAE